MGLFDIFSKKKKLKDLRTGQQIELGKKFLGALDRGISNFTPGESFGDLSVDLSPEEERSLSQLNTFLDTDVSGNEAFQTGRDVILSTARGDFDPITSPSFKAFRAEADRTKKRAIDDARRGAAIRKDFRSTGSQRVEGDILTDIANRTNTVLADLFNAERDRQISAAGKSLEIGEFELGEPLRKSKASQELGALSRINRIANLEREYQAFLNQRSEQLAALSAAGTASNQGQPQLGVDSVREPTVLGSLLKPLASGVGFALGGGAGAGAGSLLSKFFGG